MPQMNPMSWIILFFYFIYLFYLFILFIYFISFYKTSISQSKTSPKTNHLTWKW
uniref:ATP synthase F0 subunit 8 n=1 Tax=Dolophilodes bellatulus TaxID=2682779 RepID=UPI0022DCDC21|nr:ATP synthase F0 subunit 8 [Dolophilodes bellatulus]UZZ43886.1 ATP synthase F0 subunit 8 [Dolophilodes bellatulus]